MTGRQEFSVRLKVRPYPVPSGEWSDVDVGQHDAIVILVRRQSRHLYEARHLGRPRWRDGVDIYVVLPKTNNGQQEQEAQR